MIAQAGKYSWSELLTLAWSWVWMVIVGGEQSCTAWVPLMCHCGHKQKMNAGRGATGAPFSQLGSQIARIRRG
ncbi:hypothetical protein SBA7_10037 [Candidatus Sulfotelmatobacter sp. SbA7]|nr:hypothetical protein SBA7_10037 [Candidatus Sulfotelmatobacter sp. SbA7]